MFELKLSRAKQNNKTKDPFLTYKDVTLLTSLVDNWICRQKLSHDTFYFSRIIGKPTTN